MQIPKFFNNSSKEIYRQYKTYYINEEELRKKIGNFEIDIPQDSLNFKVMVTGHINPKDHIICCVLSVKIVGYQFIITEYTRDGVDSIDNIKQFVDIIFEKEKRLINKNPVGYLVDHLTNVAALEILRDDSQSFWETPIVFNDLGRLN